MLNEDYAIRIARDWNVRHDGAGFVTRFEVGTAFLGVSVAGQPVFLGIGLAFVGIGIAFLAKARKDG